MGPAGSKLKFSENFQDFFVLGNCGYKEHGYFIDIGAADGITGSNTFLLEKFYKWNGICVDPNPIFLQSLHNCRDNPVSTLCVHSETGNILPFKFLDNPDQFYGWNFRAGLKEYFELDQNTSVSFSEINVLTISLNDLLKLYNAPTDIDYISIDAEGSEFDILKTFDFEKYNVTCLTVEHAFTAQREKVYELLVSKGYERVDVDKSDNEDWFIKKNRS